MRLTDSDNSLRINHARILFQSLEAAKRALDRTKTLLKWAEARQSSDQVRLGRKTHKEEIWTLKERLFLCESDISLIDQKLTGLVCDLSRRTGETEAFIRELIGKGY